MIDLIWRGGRYYINCKKEYFKLNILWNIDNALEAGTTHGGKVFLAEG